MESFSWKFLNSSVCHSSHPLSSHMSIQKWKWSRLIVDVLLDSWKFFIPLDDLEVHHPHLEVTSPLIVQLRYQSGLLTLGGCGVDCRLSISWNDYLKSMVKLSIKSRFTPGTVLVLTLVPPCLEFLGIPLNCTLQLFIWNQSKEKDFFWKRRLK